LRFWCRSRLWGGMHVQPTWGMRAALAVLLATGFGAGSARAAPPAALQPYAFLLGAWEAAGSGTPGSGTGEARFTSELQERVIVRRSFADYPATARGPASHHEDLLVISVAPDGTVHADYYDNEGHVIRYLGSAEGPEKIAFTSEVRPGEPRYRLRYEKGTDGNLRGEFALAPAASPGEFTPYLTWESRPAQKASH
jgi:hypothetical protein